MSERIVGRTWRGLTRAADAESYLAYLRETGLRAYRSTPGNRGVLAFRRASDDRAELLLLSLWDGWDAIRQFAGDDIERPVFYPRDQQFLLDRGEAATHYEVVYHDGVNFGAPLKTRQADERRVMRNTQSLTSIAPEIFRKRLLVEGFFTRDISREVIIDYFDQVTRALGLRSYGEPVIHRTSGQGKEVNEGFDGFVPLIDSGIYVAAWTNPRFLSTVIYSCAAFDEERAVAVLRDYFGLAEHQAAIF